MTTTPDARDPATDATEQRAPAARVGQLFFREARVERAHGERQIRRRAEQAIGARCTRRSATVARRHRRRLDAGLHPQRDPPATAAAPTRERPRAVPAIRALPAAAQRPRERALLAREQIECRVLALRIALCECKTCGRDARRDRLGELRRELAGQLLLRLAGRELRPDQRELEPRTGLLLDLGQRLQYALAHRACRLLRRHARQCLGRRALGERARGGRRRVVVVVLRDRFLLAAIDRFFGRGQPRQKVWRERGLRDQGLAQPLLRAGVLAAQCRQLGRRREPVRTLAELLRALQEVLRTLGIVAPECRLRRRDQHVMLARRQNLAKPLAEPLPQPAGLGEPRLLLVERRERAQRTLVPRILEQHLLHRLRRATMP